MIFVLQWYRLELNEAHCLPGLYIRSLMACRPTGQGKRVYSWGVAKNLFLYRYCTCHRSNWKPIFPQPVHFLLTDKETRIGVFSKISHGYVIKWLVQEYTAVCCPKLFIISLPFSVLHCLLMFSSLISAVVKTYK